MASDVDISNLYIQFEGICNNTELKKMNLSKLLLHLVECDSTNSYTEIILVLARLVAATPHSADVERSISANNLQKTALKSSIKISTENNFLFIHFNLPPLGSRNGIHEMQSIIGSRQTKKQSFFFAGTRM